MGFIFTGSGFRRQCIGKSGVGKSPRSRLARPTRSSGSVQKPRLVSPLVDRRASDTPTARNNSATSKILPVLCDSSTPGNNMAPSFFELPPEVLYKVYCFAGLGSVNQLQDTCTYLHGLFDFTENDYLLEMLVRENLLIDLTAGLNPNDWREKFYKKWHLLPDFFKRCSSIQTVLLPLTASSYLKQALDCRIFSFPRIGQRHIKFLESRFGRIAIDRTTGDRELWSKRRYFEWGYMVLKKMVELIADVSSQSFEVEPELVLATAEASEQCLLFKKAHNLDEYEPIVDSVVLPCYMYERMTPQRLELVGQLSYYFHMRVTRPALLVSLFFSHNKFGIAELTLEWLFIYSTAEMATTSDVCLALSTFTKCRNWYYSSLPLDEREMCPLPPSLSRFYGFLKRILTIYYDSHNGDNDNAIWELLKAIQLPELLDHVVQLGVDVPLHLF